MKVKVMFDGLPLSWHVKSQGIELREWWWDFKDRMNDRFDVKDIRGYWREQYEEDAEGCREIGEADGVDDTLSAFECRFVHSWRIYLYVIMPRRLARRWRDRRVHQAWESRLVDLGYVKDDRGRWMNDD